MEVLRWGQDIYDKMNTCNLCGCIFKTNRDDAEIIYEDNIFKCFVECPSCHALILMGMTTQGFYRKGDKNEQ